MNSVISNIYIIRNGVDGSSQISVRCKNAEDVTLIQKRILAAIHEIKKEYER